MTAEASLTGVLTADCGLQLTDSNGGSWQLRSTVEGLIGTRQVAPPASKLTLQIVPAMDCTGRGSWRRSAPERWPITFEYPSSWRMAATGDRIVIECPDPARLARGGAPIVFRLGQGRTPAVSADGRRGTRVDRFVTFDATRWLIGETCEEIAPNESNVFCGIARQSEWRGMTVLQGSAGEHRLYRTGAGYVGQGGGIVSYAFLAGNDWVRIDSYDTPAFFDDLGAAGPVLFDGDGVTERLIRSVRRR
jgi:hypothetical protein